MLLKLQQAINYWELFIFNKENKVIVVVSVLEGKFGDALAKLIDDILDEMGIVVKVLEAEEGNE